MKNDIPEWLWPYTDNYTGPYWSDGKFQGSTSKGRKAPKSRLDKLSKAHDASYATCIGFDCLDRADQVYSLDSSNMSLVPWLIGKMPLYGNAIPRKIARLLGHTYIGDEALWVGENKRRMSRRRFGNSETTFIDPLSTNRFRGREWQNPLPPPKQTPAQTPLAPQAPEGQTSFEEPAVSPTMLVQSIDTGNTPAVLEPPPFPQGSSGYYYPDEQNNSNSVESPFGNTLSNGNLNRWMRGSPKRKKKKFASSKKRKQKKK